MTLREKINNGFLFFDGGMGTMLQQMGLKSGEIPERWNIYESEKIVTVHHEYLKSGSDILTTNTFGASPIKLIGSSLSTNDVVAAAIKNAEKAIEMGGYKREEKFIAIDIGPTGKLLKPFGELEFEDAVDNFKEVIVSGANNGADLVLIETMSDIYEAKAAIIAAKESCELPVFVSVTFSEDGKLMTGADAITVVTVLESLGVDAIGINCGLGPKQIKNILETVIRYSSTPIFVQPNAGLPKIVDGETVFDITEDEFSDCMSEFADMGVSIFGGCCGTTPSYIRKTKEKVSKKTRVKITEKNNTVVASYSKTVLFDERPILIGERINPTGKKLMKAALIENNIDYILGEAVRQQDKGVDILDVNVGIPDIVERDVLVRAITEIQAISALPLQIDTSDFAAMESAMRIYNGKPLINSVNGKRESMDKIFPLVKKYGGTVIGLTLDENGIPESSDKRMLIAEKIFSEAKKYGIKEKDIVIDPLALTISSDSRSASVTLDSIKRLSAQGRKTSLGVSNISFGLPKRDVINSTFFALALQNGLSASIMNPFSDRMMETYYSFLALNELDSNCEQYIEAMSGEEKVQNIVQDEETLESAIIRGLVEKSAKITNELLKTTPPMTIINEMIIPALDEVGKGFETKKVFLPKLLMSADASKAAFDAVKSSFSSTNAKKGEKIIIATVKGDIHDIGKNIVKTLLSNYGFDVIDLGKDVPPEAVVEAVKTHNAKLVGLSALMTTTVGAMEETIKQLSPLDCKVVVGGAVLTAEYANKIGADFYAKDAMETVRIAETLFGK